MAKNDVKEVEAVAPKSALAEEWEKFLAHYKSKNPVKHAHKLAQGQFDQPSPEFVEQFQNGTWAAAKAKLGIK